MKFIEYTKLLLLKELEKVKMEVLGGKKGETRKTSAEGVPTGEVEKFFKIECEVERRNGPLSRTQFNVKVPNGEQKFDMEDLDEKVLYVKFTDLEVSYLDSRNVFFRASDYEVYEDEEV